MPLRPEKRRRYPPNWEALSQWIRFDRAGGQCEQTLSDGRRCRARHGQWIRRDRQDPEQFTVVDRRAPGAIRVVLTTVHLDHDERNDDTANLRAMCQRCHLVYDAAHHARTRRRRRDAESGQTSLF